jgi:hemerythrin-like domain-containing protein
MDELSDRQHLPDALRFLSREYPRDGWEGHANFDEMTRFWLDRHAMFRDVLARLQAESRAYLDHDADPGLFAHRSARLTQFFLEQLHGHHTIEDRHYFPLLSAHDPRLPAGFDLLERDHQALDVHIHDLAGTTNAMLRALQAGQGRTEAGRVTDLLGTFEAFLDRHLTDEEELVVPVILQYGSPDH